RYYCDYCDKFLTHDSPSVRKTHCTGRTHKNSVREYYQKWLEEQVQKLVDHAREGASSHVWWCDGYTSSRHARSPACGCFSPPVSSDDAGPANGDEAANRPAERYAGRRRTSWTSDTSHVGSPQTRYPSIGASCGDDATPTGANSVNFPV
ncbi:U1 small nuclear ribonucleoprotein C, partial [Taenia solium]